MELENRTVTQICGQYFAEKPQSVERCSVGIGNYVFIVRYPENNYVVRCSREKNAYADSAHLLKKLSSVTIPVPELIAKGTFEDKPHDHIGIVIENRGQTFLAAEGNVNNVSALIERPFDEHIRAFIRLPDGYRYK